MIYRKDGKVFDGAFGNKYDIIGKWEDEIERPDTPYEIKPDKPKEIKPIKGGSGIFDIPWWQKRKV